MTCPNQISTLTLSAGETIHVTCINSSCAQVGPSGITAGGSAIVGGYITAVADATGFNITGVNATSVAQNLIMTGLGMTPANITIIVTNPMFLTSP